MWSGGWIRNHKKVENKSSEVVSTAKVQAPVNTEATTLKQTSPVNTIEDEEKKVYNALNWRKFTPNTTEEEIIKLVRKIPYNTSIKFVGYGNEIVHLGNNRWAYLNIPVTARDDGIRDDRTMANNFLILKVNVEFWKNDKKIYELTK